MSKILLFDIETSPNNSYTWGMYDQNVIHILQEWEILSFAWKFLGDKKVKCLTRNDFKRDKTDKPLVTELHTLMDKADAVVAHNGKAFDFKKARTRFLYHGLPPSSPVKEIDTKTMAKSMFGFTTNKLDHLGEFLGLGRKVEHEGFGLWLKCMNGDASAWKRMAKYNKQDVVLLEKVYLKLRAWTPHPNMAQMSGKPKACPRCGSERLKSKGWQHTNTTSYRQIVCLGCGGYLRSDEKKHGPEGKPIRAKYKVVA